MKATFHATIRSTKMRTPWEDEVTFFFNDPFPIKSKSFLCRKDLDPNFPINGKELFEVLNQLKPRYQKIELVFHRDTINGIEYLGGTVYVDGKVKHNIFSSEMSEEDIALKMEELKSFYLNPPTLFPNCRFVMATYFGMELDKSFNLEFDRLTKEMKSLGLVKKRLH